MYYDKQEPIKYIPSHRILAINRGEKEEYIKVKKYKNQKKKILIYIEKDTIKRRNTIHRNAKSNDTRLIQKTNRTINRQRNTFRSNRKSRRKKSNKSIWTKLKTTITRSTNKRKNSNGFDPAYRTGCKIAVIDETGKVLDYTTVYPTEPQNDVEGAKKNY